MVYVLYVCMDTCKKLYGVSNDGNQIGYLILIFFLSFPSFLSLSPVLKLQNRSFFNVYRVLKRLPLDIGLLEILFYVFKSE